MLMIEKNKTSESRFLHCGALSEHWEPMDCSHVLLWHELKQKIVLTVSKQYLHSLHNY